MVNTLVNIYPRKTLLLLTDNIFYLIISAYIRHKP